jgi:putative ABC transport system permease protein
VTPPRAAVWLLTRALGDAAERDMVLGDLEEEIDRRGAAWYWRQAVSIAAHAALRRTGVRDQYGHGGTSMHSILNDVRYGWRALAKRPLVTATIAGTLALGLGANAAIFNIVDRLVFRPYPLVDPDHGVLLAETGGRLQFKQESVSPANFLDWRAQAKSLQFLSAIEWWDANLSDRGDPERVPGFYVSAAFFDALGVRPALGRGFVRDDETWGRHRVAILSDALWKRRFGANPAVVGSSIAIDGEPHEIVGIAPPRFSFPEGSEIWAPLSFDPAQTPPRDIRYLTVIGRLAPGRTLHDAQAEMSLVADRLAREYPDADRDHGVRAYTFTRGMLDEGTGPMLALWQVSAFVVLLIACANIVNLLLARGAERRRETAVRLALGATRWRIARELLTESVVLALVAVPPALACAAVSLRVIRSNMPARIMRFVPGFESLGMDARLVAFTVALALLTACVFGILPALQAARATVAATLKEGGRTATGRQLLRRALVVAEMAIALPLLVAAGLGATGSHRFLDGPQGYDPDGVLTMKLILPVRTYPDADGWRRFVERAIDAIAPLPGVAHAAAINNMPAGMTNATRPIAIDGHPAADPKNPPRVEYLMTTTEYFAVMRIPVRRGRAFTTADRRDSPPVGIVSEAMARTYWPGVDPIGRRVKVDGTWVTVVGVCGDIIQDWFNRRNVETLYRPMAQVPSNYLAIVVRAAGDPAALAGPVRNALLRVDATQPVFEMMTMRTALKERTVGLQYLAAIMITFGGLALLLAGVGLYALIAYLVAQRRHEIGIRIALGASSRDVMRLTTGQALRLALFGTGIGLVLAVALSRVMESGVLGVAVGDVRIFVVFAAVLVGTALLAGYIPARRAAAIDPIDALRVE